MCVMCVMYVYTLLFTQFIQFIQSIPSTSVHSFIHSIQGEHEEKRKVYNTDLFSPRRCERSEKKGKAQRQLAGRGEIASVASWNWDSDEGLMG